MTRSAFVGVGYAATSRDKGIDARPLAVHAARAAIADAGLTVSDIDSVFEYAGHESAIDIARMLGLENLVAYADYTPLGPSGLAAAIGAHMAVLSGASDVALVVRSVTREWGQMTGRALPAASGRWQWELPDEAAGGIIPVNSPRAVCTVWGFWPRRSRNCAVSAGLGRCPALRSRPCPTAMGRNANRWF